MSEADRLELQKRAEENVQTLMDLMLYHDSIVSEVGDLMTEALRDIIGLPYSCCLKCSLPFYLMVGTTCYLCEHVTG